MSESTTNNAEPEKYFKDGQWWSAKQGEWIGEGHLLHY